MDAIEKCVPGSFAWKPADAFNLGVPDIHAVLAPDGMFLVAEVKELPKLLTDGELLRLSPNAKLLKHTFKGPQVSMLRRLAKAGCKSWGIVRTHKDMAYRLDPEVIPIEGQVTPRLLFARGRPFSRQDKWRFWECSDR